MRRKFVGKKQSESILFVANDSTSRRLYLDVCNKMPPLYIIWGCLREQVSWITFVSDRQCFIFVFTRWDRFDLFGFLLSIWHLFDIQNVRRVSFNQFFEKNAFFRKYSHRPLDVPVEISVQGGSKIHVLGYFLSLNHVRIWRPKRWVVGGWQLFFSSFLRVQNV